MIQPLYVMNSSLQKSVPFHTYHNVTRPDLHDEEGIEYLHSIQRSLDKLRLLLSITSRVSP